MNNHHNTAKLASLKHKNILITGATGMLGTAFKEILNVYVPSAKVHAFGKNDLNVCDHTKVLECKHLHPDIIIHCAALVNADYCEDNEDEAFAVIVQGMRNIIELAMLTGSKVFLPQSFLIYDGKELPITEATIPNPLGVYGKLKLMAEKLLCEDLPNALVVRMAGFFGGREIDKNFVGKIVPHIGKIVNNGRYPIEVGDRVWQPTYTNDLAYNCLVLLAHDKSGIYCMASHGKASFFELTSFIVNSLEIGDIIKIIKVSSAAMGKNDKAQRPEVAIIENDRLKKEQLDFQRNWQDSLLDYIKHPYFKKLVSHDPGLK